MKKLIRLTESDLHRIINKTVYKILKEGYHDTVSDEDDEKDDFFDPDGNPPKFKSKNKNRKLPFEMEGRRIVNRKRINEIDEVSFPSNYGAWSDEDFEPLYFDDDDEEVSENTIRRAVRESINKLMKEENGGGATSCANVMQTGSGKAPLGTNPEAGQYTVPLGADKETSDRHKGFSVDGKAKWNKNPGNVQRKPIYNPKG